MFPYSPPSAEDEPTRTDLRGVLPAHRPPVDATALEEPTSEVPVITPPADPAPADQTGPEAAAGEVAVVDGPGDTATLADPALADPAIEDDPPALADPTIEDDPPALADPEIEDDPPALADPAIEDLLVESEDPAPEPAVGEMSKMTWTPAPFRPDLPPPPVPATPLAEAEPVTLPGPAPEPALAAAPASEPALAPEPAAPVTAGLVSFAPPVEPAAPAPALAGRPGDVAEHPIALWSEAASDRLRSQWRDLQSQFIDDPDAAVAGAKALVTEAVHELADTLLAAQDALDPYRGSGRVDTETMRVAMRRYREFLERVLAL
jgi:hypothetical protein